MIKLHLYFGKNDVDLIQWRFALPKNTLSKYIIMVLEAEINNKLVKNFPPAPEFDTAFTLKQSYNTIVIVNNVLVEQYLNMIPEYQRNALIKRILRKNIQASSHSFNNFIPVDNNSMIKPKKAIPQKNKSRQESTENNNYDFNICVPKDTQPQPDEAEKSELSSNEENPLKAALLMMAGE